MDIVRSYVVPSLHFAEVVHLREDENTDDEVVSPSSESSSITSSPSSLSPSEAGRKSNRTGGFISSMESTNTSVETPSPHLNFLDALKRPPEECEESEVTEGSFLVEALQDTTQEIDIDAILGYPSEEKIENEQVESCDEETITVIEEGEYRVQRDPLEFTNGVLERKKSVSKAVKENSKFSIFDKIKASLSRNGVVKVPKTKSPLLEQQLNELNLYHNSESVLENPEDEPLSHPPVERIPSFNLNRTNTQRKSIFKKFIVPSAKRSSRRRYSNGHVESRDRSESFSRNSNCVQKENSPTTTPTNDDHEEPSPGIQKSSSFGGILSQSMFPLGKFSDRSLPRRNRRRESTDKQDEVRRRPRSLSRSKFGLPNRRSSSSLVRAPSPKALQEGQSKEKIEDFGEPRSVNEVNPKMCKSEPSISESPRARVNPQRQYGRRSGRFRRVPPSQEVITIRSRPSSAERPSSSNSREDQRRPKEANLRSRQRASSLPRLNSSSRQRRQSQARNSTHGNDICSLQ